MGSTTQVVKRSNRRSKQAHRQINRIRLYSDVWLIGAVVAMTIFGAIMVRSASFYYEARSTQIFLRQLTFIVVGLLSMTGIGFLFDYRWSRKIAVFAGIGTLLMLFAVAILSVITGGTVRALFGDSVQPSELAKLVLIIYLAVWLEAKQDVIRDFNWGFLSISVLLGVVGIMILLQPDISAAITVVFLGLLMYFLGGAQPLHILLAFAMVAFMVWVMISFNPLNIDRITQFTIALDNIQEASYHVQRSLEAFSSATLFGKGLGESEIKFTGLPVPHTDSIFAVIVEETGLVGGISLMLGYLVILWRGMLISHRAPDFLGKLIAAGLTIWIVLEAFINIGSMLVLIPFAGNALPLISYGGSSLITTLFGVGIILSIARKSEIQRQEKERSPFGEVVNLRRGNRRGRVSRYDSSRRSRSRDVQ